MHQYTRIPLGRAFALSLLITLCGLVVIEIPEMLLLPQIYADRSYYPSALQFVLDPIYFGGFILVIPLAAALPYTNSFVMRLKTGNWYYAMIRCGKKRYLQKECLSAFIRGGGGVALGFVTYTILCNMLFLPSNPQKYTSHILPFDDTIYEQMYQSAGGIPMYLYDPRLRRPGRQGRGHCPVPFSSCVQAVGRSSRWQRRSGCPIRSSPSQRL